MPRPKTIIKILLLLLSCALLKVNVLSASSHWYHRQHQKVIRKNSTLASFSPSTPESSNVDVEMGHLIVPVLRNARGVREFLFTRARPHFRDPIWFPYHRTRILRLPAYVCSRQRLKFRVGCEFTLFLDDVARLANVSVLRNSNIAGLRTLYAAREFYSPRPARFTVSSR